MKKLLICLITALITFGCGFTATTPETSLSATPEAKRGAFRMVPTAPEMIVAAEVLHVRDKPGGTVIDYLYNGDPVTVYQQSGTWCKISDTEPRWVACWWLE